jgi:hypothetical protein
MLGSEGRVHRGTDAAWEEGGCVTTGGNRAVRRGGFSEALPVICPHSLLIDSIGKALKNLSSLGRIFAEHHDTTEAQK